MRSVDKWVGVPLTFLFSIFLWFYDKLLLINPKRPDIRRTLFIELSEMGSAILVDPAMRKLRDQGKAELYFAIFTDNSKSLDLLKTVPKKNVFLMRSDNMVGLAIDVLRFAVWCRKKKITCVIDLELFSRFTALLTGISGAHSRIGFATHHDEGMYRGSILNFPVRYNAHVHIAENFIAQVNTALGFHNTPYATTPIAPEELVLEQAEVNEEDVLRVKDKITKLCPAYHGQRIVLINANASDLLPQRRWLPDRFAEVTRQLLQKFPDILVLATGAPKEYRYVQDVVEMVGDGRFVNSAGAFDFLELLPLYTISTVMLTNDSGPAHFASVTPLKVFVIFADPGALWPPGQCRGFLFRLALFTLCECGKSPKDHLPATSVHHRHPYRDGGHKIDQLSE